LKASVRAIVRGNRGFTDLRLDAANRGDAGVNGLPRLQPYDDAQPPAGSPVEHALLAPNERLGSKGNRDIEGAPDFDSEKLGRRDADDRVRDALNRQRLPDDVGGAEIFRLPIAIADDGYRAVGSGAAAVVRLVKRPSENCRHPQHFKDSTARPEPVDVLCLRVAREIEPGRRVRERALKQILSLAYLFPDGIGPGVPSLSCPDDHQPIGCLHRQRFQHQAVEDGEDSRVRADSERERQDRDERDHRCGS
jgi:hypothetical protein